MIIDNALIGTTLQHLAEHWSTKAMIYPNLKKMPHSERPCNTAISPGILWPLNGKLDYACNNGTDDWSFKTISVEEYFYFKTDEWMLRNSNKRFCLCKIEWLPDITLITVNDNATKHYFEKNALPNSLRQQFFDTPQQRENPAVFHLFIHSLIGLCLSHLLSAPQQALNKSYRTFLACCEHLREQLDQDINRSAVARMLQIHPGHVSRLFKQYHPGGYDAWLRQERVARARHLLRNHKLSVESIARLCGISNVSWFIRCFKDETQMTPGQYRQQHY